MHPAGPDLYGQSAGGSIQIHSQVAVSFQAHTLSIAPRRPLRERIGLALVGRAGARLAAAAAVPIGRMTLIRLVKALPDPERLTPRVLGVDDFATRRAPVQHRADRLRDAPRRRRAAGRDSAPLTRWLVEHPGVEVICWDRAGAYAEGVCRGAPDAVQVEPYRDCATVPICLQVRAVTLTCSQTEEYGRIPVRFSYC
ncbi:hypothetical protein GCM10009839_87680 [Catenulispora yoronensis]|uniref:Transposase IS204/IS1001/IS1096/IS1165 DDE domain-containing protein n=1 Tax=Catenulispora yoronensis TaxID=450799 RepID=A0ABP5H1U3_9ACTN